MKINRLLLASTSPYRLALLKQIGIDAETRKPHCDEDKISAPSPSELAAARSEAKGLSLLDVDDSCLVLDACPAAGAAAIDTDEEQHRFCGHRHSATRRISAPHCMSLRSSDS